MLKYGALAPFIALAVNAKRGWGAECHDVETQQDFDMERYMGTWYEQYRDYLWGHHESVFQNTKGICNHTKYRLTEDYEGYQVIDVTILQWLEYDKYNGIEIPKWDGGKGTAHQANPAKKNGYLQLNGHWRNHALFPEGDYGDYRILDTDYDNYSVIYNCTGGDSNVHYSEFAWILTR